MQNIYQCAFPCKAEHAKVILAKLPPIVEEEPLLRQIIVFTKSANLKTIKGLKDAASHHNCEILAVNPFESSTLCTIKGPFQDFKKDILEDRPALILVRTSGVEFDDSDLYLAQDLEKKGHQLVIPISSQLLLRNKNAQALWLSERNIPMVETLLHRGPLTSDDLAALKKINKSNEFVVKSIRGNKGIGILKMTQEELLLFWDNAIKKGDQRYLIQPYYQGRELRQLILGEQHFFIEKMAINKNKEWRRNAEFSTFVPLKENLDPTFSREALIERAKAIKEELKLKTFALDLLQDPEDPKNFVVLEINANPGLESASEAFKEEDLYRLYLEALLK
jgi:glutathione synthase/RimK-type ligase-like ATP-grasp enzyme